MRKVIYGLAILALLCVAAVDCPTTDTPVPPTATDVRPSRTPRPTETPKPTLTPYIPDVPTVTATIEQPPVDTVTPYPAPGTTPGTGGHPKPTPTWDCNREYNPEKCLAPTGSGEMPANVKLGLRGIAGVLLLGVIVIARGMRNAPR